jgi:hypothetical protein
MSSQKTQLFADSESDLPPPPGYTAEAVQLDSYRDNPHPEARIQYPAHLVALAQQHSSAREEDQGVFCSLNVLGSWISIGKVPTRVTSATSFQDSSLGKCACYKPRLKIHAAVFADRDITAKVQSMVTVDQTLSLDGMRANEYFGSVWYGTRKAICILYQYEGREMELLVTCEDEMIKLDHSEPVDACRLRMLRSEGKVMAVVWGLRDGLQGPSGELRKNTIENYNSVECTNDWFGFDGYPNEVKSCTVFLRDGDGVRVVTARENETLSMV